MLNEEFIKSVKPDPRGRLGLGNDVIGDIDKFHVLKTDDGDIILRPYIEIPKKELWLLSNVEVIKHIRESLNQSKEGKVSKLDLSDLEDE